MRSLAPVLSIQLDQNRQGVGTDGFQSIVGKQLDEGHREKEGEKKSGGMREKVRGRGSKKKLMCGRKRPAN